MTRRFGFLVILVSAIAAITAHASFPLGVYAVIEKVVLEPGDAEPQRVQIWGTFSLWDDRTGLGYGAPERGYLYYSCSKEQSRICRNEWADSEVGCRVRSDRRIWKPVALRRTGSRARRRGFGS